MSNLFVKVVVTVAAKEYTYSGKHGEAEISLQVPRDFLIGMDAGTLFSGVVRAALANYEAILQEDNEESDV